MNKYTYDIYGRQATRSFDTDATKAGYERVDTYHKDIYGRDIRTDQDAQGDALPINTYTTREFDIYGRETLIRIFDSQGNMSRKNVIEYDAYGQRAKDTSYTNENTVNISSIYKRDEYGRIVVDGRDYNLDGELGTGDIWRESVYNDQGQVYKATDVNRIGVKTTTIWSYDEFGRRSDTFIDSNGNGQWDNGETKHLDIYYGTGRDRDAVYRFVYPDNENTTHILKFVYNNAGNQGTQIGTLDAPQGKEFKTFNYSVYGTQVNSVEDYTTDSWNSFFDKVGGSIEVINMTDARAKTEITLDNDILSKITGSQLRIAGDATDTVNLKDSAEFTKLEGTKRVSGNDYHQYETQVGEGTYTLLIDTDVNINPL